MNIPNNLYRQIVKLMPISCVDLLVADRLGRVLMLKRNHPPAEGQWWFPGGRVFYRELRIDAARRKLKEECGLEAISIQELGTYDLVFDCIPSNYASHGITTVFHVVVDQNNMRLDNQSADYAWKLVNDWLKEVDHEFLLAILKLYTMEFQSKKA
jgi:colanic acid biosynthesis protein WcaH